ncbi:uncharacterized protein LOC127723682 [Mytilus californianus]|uniref:uncharacterized protein LOC127723682 n=1 Tax=Mytilus californianus TaxID=6549 RepID=UPI002246009D|nr:uncharacterized protein LOC127723682 [Mytilus californianus]
MTTVPAKVANDSTDFHSAVKAFLTRMVEVCQIDTTVPCNVEVTLHILNSNELNVTYSLSNKPTEHKFVQTEVEDPSTTPYLPDFDDGSPMYGDDTIFCCSCLQSNKQVVIQSYCLDCSEPICEKCGSLHATFAQPHTITSKVNEDIVYQSSLTVSKFCSVHKNQVTNSFCTQHDALLCDTCAIDGHNSCMSVLSIQKAAENVAEGAIMSDLEYRLHNLGIVIESLITTEEKNILHVNAEKDKVHKEVNSIKQRICLHLDRLEREFADRLTDVAERSKLSHKYYLPSKLRITKTLQNDMESTNTFESESDIFKALKILDGNVCRQESAIRNFLKDVQFRRLEFNPLEMETIEIFLPKLGSLTVSNTPITSLDVRGQLHLVGKRGGNILFLDSFKSDDIGCSVGSGCFITESKLLFTNFEGKYSLHICDRHGLRCTMIKLDGVPLDVATYNSTLVLVTIRNRGIRIINVDTNMCGRYIYLGIFLAIQCENRNIWTSTSEATIYRIDIEGHLLQSFNVGFVARQIALNITGEHVFYSPLTSDKIFTLSTDGQQALFYTCPEKTTVHGLAVDCNGNVLIADKIQIVFVAYRKMERI